MLGYFFTILILLSVVFAVTSGRIPETTQAVISGAGDAVTLCISLTGAICLWSGVMNVAQKAGIVDFLSRLISPFIRRVMRSLPPGSDAEKAVCMNISANFMGLGNAATPYGLKAMRHMADQSPRKGAATRDMILFTVLNCASIQLIPTTIAAIRASAGAKAPFDILPAVWISSATAALCGLLMAYIFTRRDRVKK